MNSARELLLCQDEDEVLHFDIHNFCHQVQDTLDLIAGYKTTPEVVIGKDDWDELRNYLRNLLIEMETLHQAIRRRLYHLQCDLESQGKLHTQCQTL